MRKRRRNITRRSTPSSKPFSDPPPAVGGETRRGLSGRAVRTLTASQTHFSPQPLRSTFGGRNRKLHGRPTSKDRAEGKQGGSMPERLAAREAGAAANVGAL